MSVDYAHEIDRKNRNYDFFEWIGCKLSHCRENKWNESLRCSIIERKHDIWNSSLTLGIKRKPKNHNPTQLIFFITTKKKKTMEKKLQTKKWSGKC